MGGMLLFTATAKFIGIASGGITEGAIDSVMGYPLNVVLVLAASLELMLAGWLMLKPYTPTLKGALLLTGFVFSSYRLLSPDNRPCPCMGSSGSVLGVPLETQGQIALAVLVYLILSALMMPYERNRFVN